MKGQMDESAGGLVSSTTETKTKTKNKIYSCSTEPVFVGREK